MKKVEVYAYVNDEQLLRKVWLYAILAGVVGLLGLLSLLFLSRTWNVAVGAILLALGYLLVLLEREAYQQMVASRREVTIAHVETDDPDSLTFDAGDNEVIAPAKVRIATKVVDRE